MYAVFNLEIWAENSENFNKIGDVTRTISSGKAEFANVVEFVNVVRIFDNLAVSCRLNNTCSCDKKIACLHYFIHL